MRNIQGRIMLHNNNFSFPYICYFTLEIFSHKLNRRIKPIKKSVNFVGMDEI